MPRLSYDRWLEVGAVVAGLGGAAAIARYVYAREQSEGFWGTEAAVAVAVLGVGLLMLAVGFFRSGDAAPNQTQTGGNNSRNQQAGRDIRFNDRGD